MRKCVVRADQTIDNVEHDQVRPLLRLLWVCWLLWMHTCVQTRTHTHTHTCVRWLVHTPHISLTPITPIPPKNNRR